MLTFGVRSLGGIQDMSRTADAGDMPRCNFVLSPVGMVNCGSTTGVRSPAGGRAAVPCSVTLLMTAVTTTRLGLLPLRCLSTVCFSLLEVDKTANGPKRDPTVLFPSLPQNEIGFFWIIYYMSADFVCHL